MKAKKRMITIIMVLIGGALGFTFLPSFWRALALKNVNWLQNNYLNFVIGAFLCFLLSFIMVNWLMKIIQRSETYLNKQSTTFLLFGSIGAVVGLGLANIVSIPLYAMKLGMFSTIIPIVLMIILGYLGFRLGTTRLDEWRKLFQPRKRNANQAGDVLERKADDNFRKYKILDTSVIIDGRIYDIAKTGFIEGTLLIPIFVLHELQLIADSADSLKRTRGRRGLDILNTMQKDKTISVEMYDGDFEDMTEVDSKLIRLAKLIDGIVVTNDYNLNKVSEFQNVPVLNINELANTLKPVVIPGEKMQITVVKAGSERQQGVGYLDDGTMVVVEEGQNYLNKPMTVVVTSALQTAAGRMIFAQPEHRAKGIEKPKS